MKTFVNMLLGGVAIMGCREQSLVLRWENPERHALERTYRVRITSVHKEKGIRSSASMAGPLHPVTLKGRPIGEGVPDVELVVVASELELPKGLKAGDISEWLIAKENVCIGIRIPPAP